ncbi:MAG: hypothetical protein K8F24_11860, partial [Bacteroidales bacterium]|nr:hypothetical protein [Bacteroidales bacterium]
ITTNQSTSFSLSIFPRLPQSEAVFFYVIFGAAEPFCNDEFSPHACGVIPRGNKILCKTVLMAAPLCHHIKTASVAGLTSKKE